MKIIGYFFAGILGIATTGIVLAHGGGSDATKTYEADTPKLIFRQPYSSFSLSDDNATPFMKLSVIGQTIRITFKDIYGESMNVDDAEAKAFISSGGKAAIIHLLPVFGGALSGTGDFISEPDMRVDLTLRLMGQRPMNQTFYPLR